MNAFVIAGIEINGTAYRQLNTISVDPAIEKMINSGGELDTVFAAMLRSKPLCRFSSRNLAMFLDVCGPGGLAIDTTFNVYFAAYQHGGTRSYTACFKCTFNDGLIMLSSLRASHQQEAEAQYEVYATYDGTNNPLTFATGATCPADSGTVAKFTLGPLKLGSTVIETQDLEFNLGAETGLYGNNGESFDRMACIKNRKPMISGTTLNLNHANTVTPTGLSSAVTAYFRKKSNKGNSVADATAEHISLYATGAYVTMGTIEGSEGKEASAKIEAQLVWDGTNDIVAVDTTAAIA